MFNGTMGFDIDERLEWIQKHKWMILGGIGLIAILIIIISGLTREDQLSNYKDLESTMVSKAEIYAADNDLNFNTDNNAYLDLSALGLSTNNTDCSVTSGVLVSKGNGAYYYTPYLMCNNYSSASVGADVKYDNITLRGGSVVVIKAGEKFIDPGYSADSSYKVRVDGEVGETSGIYTLNYVLVKNNVDVNSVKRDVIVGEYNDEQLALANANANAKYPVITLKGDSTMTVQQGSTFEDPGYIVADKTDRENVDVNISGEVNTKVPDDYIRTYTARNSLGYIREVTRKIVVVPSINNNITVNAAVNTKNYVTNDIAITLNISGASYNYTLLPNNTRDYRKNVEYAVASNGNYIFKVYDKNGNFTVKEVRVGNIDNTNPMGTCISTISADKTEIEVSATDSGSGIDKYAYSTGVDYSEYTNSNKYTINKTSTVSYVRLLDKAGNVSVIMCSSKPSTDALVIDGPSNVKIGETITLVAKENNIVNNSVTWTIEGDNTIASISSSGVVTGLKEGTVTVKATTSLGKSATKSISVNTTSSGNSDYDLNVPKDQSVVYVGETLTLTTSKVFGKAVSGTITWTSSDPSKATINGSGVVTGVSVGMVTISATASSGESATHKVTVIKPSCGNHAVILSGSVDGATVPDHGTVRMSLGQTKNVRVVVPSVCGTPKVIARTDGSGSSNRDSIVQRSFLPHRVDRYDSSTWFEGDGFNLVLKSVGQGTAQVNITLYYYTTDGLGFKSFYHLNVVVS